MTTQHPDPRPTLSAIPGLLANSPGDGIVAIGCDGVGRPCVVVAFRTRDLDSLDAGAAAENIARALAGGVESVVMVTRDRAPRAGEVLDRIATALKTRVDVTDALVVRGDTVRSLWCWDTACCPAEGLSLRATQTPEQVAPGHVDREGRAAARREGLEAWRSAVEAARTGAGPLRAEVAALSRAIEDLWVRDAIIVDLVPGSAKIANALCEDARAPGVREALERMLTPHGAVAPKESDTRAAFAVLAQVHKTHPSAHASSVTALLSWWSAEPDAAREHAWTALRYQEGHRLARLVIAALDAGLDPGWLVRDAREVERWR